MSADRIQIDETKCRKDAVCISICPVGIFTGELGELPVVAEDLAVACIKCGHCSAACPTDAISVPGLAVSQYEPLPASIPDFKDFLGLMKSRRSIREFTDQPVDLKLINELLELTRYCPTAKNTQLLHWVLVNGKEKVRELSAAVIDAFRSNERLAAMVQAFEQGFDPINRGAPQVLLACGPAKYDWGQLDAAIAIASLELAAKTAGLGSCWAGFTTRGASQGPQVNEKIGLPADHKVFGAVMLGYPRFDYYRVPPRKPLSVRII